MSKKSTKKQVRHIDAHSHLKIDTSTVPVPPHVPLDCRKPEFAHLRTELYRRHAIVTLNTKARG